MTQTCSTCGHEASGRFCSECGAALAGPRSCTQCGHEIPEEGRFCNRCGTPVPTGDADAPERVTVVGAPPVARATGPVPLSTLLWLVAGGIVMIVAGILVGRQLAADDDPETGIVTELAGPPAAADAAGDPRAVDLSTMSPREAADRLFNRVMQNVSSGDTAAARQFLPMALMAYERVPDLDLDGRYHLAVLHLVNADPQAALREAETIIAAEPDHLFGLFTAAQARQAMGDGAAARDLYGRFLAAYDTEIERELPEYRDHAPVLPSMREEARGVAGG